MDAGDLGQQASTKSRNPAFSAVRVALGSREDCVSAYGRDGPRSVNKRNFGVAKRIRIDDAHTPLVGTALVSG
jgi:hypothetical protein